jgi:hypothetical protein
LGNHLVHKDCGKKWRVGKEERIICRKCDKAVLENTDVLAGRWECRGRVCESCSQDMKLMWKNKCQDCREPLHLGEPCAHFIKEGRWVCHKCLWKRMQRSEEPARSTVCRTCENKVWLDRAEIKACSQCHAVVHAHSPEKEQGVAGKVWRRISGAKNVTTPESRMRSVTNRRRRHHRSRKRIWVSMRYAPTVTSSTQLNR